MPTYDFYVADGQPFTVRSNAYDQDCFDGQFGIHDLLLSGRLLGGPTYGAGNQDIAAGDYNMLFTITSEALTVEDSVDLSLIKACKPDLSPARAGQQIICTIVVTNPGPGLPRNVVVRDTLLTSVAPTDYTMDAPTFTLSGGGSSSPCEPTVAIAGGKQFQCNFGTVPVGGSAVSLLPRTNAGPSKAPSATIRDFLPDSVTVLSVNGGGAGASCVPGIPGDPAHPTRCSYATLAPSAMATMVIVVPVKPGDHKVVTNEANVASDVLDLDTSNNTQARRRRSASRISRS